LAPDPLNPLVVHPPAFVVQKIRDPAVAVSTVRFGQGNDPCCDGRLIIGLIRLVSLHSVALPEHPARLLLSDSELLEDMLDGETLACRTQKFPRFTSFRVEKSRVWSAISFFCLWFFFSRSFTL